MTCQRCHGSMVVDHYIDMEDDGGHVWLRAWRCGACGMVVDSRVRRRRLLFRSAFARVQAIFSRNETKTRDVVKLSA